MRFLFVILAALVAALPISASAERIVEVEINGEMHTLHVIEDGDIGDVISVSSEDVVLGPRVSASSLSNETGKFTFPATANANEVWFETTVAYSNGVAALADPQTIQSGAEALVNQSNLPFRNSDLPQRFLVTELRHFQYNETGKLIDEWTAFYEALTTCDGRVHILLVNGGDVRGIAAFKTGPGCHSPVMVLNVSGFFPSFHNLDFLARTLSHEEGHGFGLGHHDSCESGGYNCGYCLSNGWCDIMGTAGPHLPFFSSPEATYQGQPMGVEGQADAVRYLRENLEDYRSKMAEVTPPLTCKTGTCWTDGNSVCLLGRFEIVVGFDDPNDTEDTFELAGGFSWNATSAAGTGLYYFFTQDNTEVLLKMLDACVEPFNRYWIFIAGLTNVETEVQVCDTWTGKLETYYNPQGVAFESVQDTSTLKCDF